MAIVWNVWSDLPKAKIWSNSVSNFFNSFIRLLKLLSDTKKKVKINKVEKSKNILNLKTDLFDRYFSKLINVFPN